MFYVIREQFGTLFCLADDLSTFVWFIEHREFFNLKRSEPQKCHQPHIFGYTTYDLDVRVLGFTHQRFLTILSLQLLVMVFSFSSCFACGRKTQRSQCTVLYCTVLYCTLCPHRDKPRSTDSLSAGRLLVGLWGRYTPQPRQLRTHWDGSLLGPLTWFNQQQ